MPKTTTHHKKRRGLHHRQSHKYLRTYLPYLPVVISVALSLLISSWQPARHGTLAYATEMSLGGLLQSTNVQRENNGQPDLNLNQQLNTAAQAKANDMVARNYWSHNTPDGQEPWVFFDNAGYKYLKAGENLAYGFATSNDTITGWMNSEHHRENLLDSAFSDVGFGFANGSDYNSSGPETIVVAMYGKPQTLAANANNSTPAAPIAPKAQPPTQPVAALPVAQPTPVASSPKVNLSGNDFPTIAAYGGLQPVTRAQNLTKGYAPWSSFALGVLSGCTIILMLIKHGYALRHVIRDSERLVLRQLHNPLFDSIVLSISILSLTLSHAVGFIA